MRRLSLLLIATAVALFAVLPPVVHATHGSVGANYKFVIDGDNGGETPTQPAIQLKGTVSVAADETATAQLTMRVTENGMSTTYRSCVFPACGGVAVAQINDDTVIVTIEMVALELNGIRPSPPVALTVEIPRDASETHPDFLWQPATFAIGQLKWGAKVINISYGSPCNEDCN